MNFCIHKMNPRSCPSCYNLKPEPAKAEQSVSDKQKIEHQRLLAEAQERTERSQAEIARRAQESMANAKAGGNAPAAGTNPYRSADAKPGTFDETGLWIPAQHVDISGRAPRHPNAGAGNPIVLNPTPHVKKFD